MRHGRLTLSAALVLVAASPTGKHEAAPAAKPDKKPAAGKADAKPDRPAGARQTDVGIRLVWPLRTP